MRSASDERVRLYEQSPLLEVAGETIRPGGLELTDRALAYCALPVGSRLLDVGCGPAASSAHLVNHYGFDAIGLDPCSNDRSIVRAATEWRLERDGDSLTRDWRGHGLTFVNPPYSRWLKRWMAKCSMSGAEIISLTPARTDTKAWHSFASTAEAVCFWRGRMWFLDATAPAPFPSALCYWPPADGPSRVERFEEIFSTVGLVFRTPHRRAGEKSQIALAL